MSDLNKWISEVQESLAKGHETHLIFDLDSTLFCVSPRTEEILRQSPSHPEMKNYRDSHSESLEKLKNLKTEPTDWGIRTALIRQDIVGRIDFFQALRNIWAEGFFSNRFLNKDIPYTGSVEFVQHCHKMGAQIWYLTGRDWERMGKGTLEQLERHQLPLENPKRLNMKKKSGEEDANYKSKFFGSFAHPLNQTWFIDNEPVLLNQVHRDHQDLNLVFADTVHSGRENLTPNLLRVGFEWDFKKS